MSTASPYITDALLVAAIVRLYTELRAETRQAREDKIAAIAALNNATVAIKDLSEKVLHANSQAKVS